MAFNYSPKIITDGLVLYLDAANTRSYLGSGTVWSDLSRGGNNGTLTNGPTFNSGNGGNIVFDGVNDSVNCGNSTNLQITVGSVNTWFRGTQQGVNYNGIVVKQNAWGIFINQSTLHTYDWGNSAGRNTGINVSDNVWRNVCLTFTETVGTPTNNARIYINGILILTTTIKHLNQSAPFLLGYGNSPNQYLQGSISQTSIYNRALSATEILQNYNATKGRYGL
jgi:hypothetical protein